MAGYRGHIKGGILSCLAYVAALIFLPFSFFSLTGGLFSKWQLIVGLVVVAVLFALWPDIDTNSKGQDIFFGLAFGLDVLLIWQGYIETAAYLGLLAMTPIVGKHRGWTHSRFAMILVPLPILVVPYLYRESLLSTAVLFYGSAVVGYFSHLLLDGRITKRFRVKT